MQKGSQTAKNGKEAVTSTTWWLMFPKNMISRAKILFKILSKENKKTIPNSILLLHLFKIDS